MKLATASASGRNGVFMARRWWREPCRPTRHFKLELVRLEPVAPDAGIRRTSGDTATSRRQHFFWPLGKTCGYEVPFSRSSKQSSRKTGKNIWQNIRSAAWRNSEARSSASCWTRKMKNRKATTGCTST